MWKINKSTWSLEENQVAYPQNLDRRNIYITSMSEDKDGNLWCTSIQNGVMMIPAPSERQICYKQTYLDLYIIIIQRP